MLPLLLVAVVVSTAAADDLDIGSVQVYLTPEQALAQAHPGAVYEAQVVGLSAQLQQRLDRRAGRPFAPDSVAIHVAHDAAGKRVGYAVIGDQIGKYRPITYLVATDEQFRVADVSVLVFRESRGGEVRRTRFLRQYDGKDAGDAIRINRDITNITGATMSVRALNAGVRASLMMLEELFEPTPD